MKMTGFDELIKDVRHLEDSLRRPAFFEEKYRDYLNQARQVAMETLMAYAPADEDKQRHASKAQRIVESVIAELLVDGNGVMVAIASSQEEPDGIRPAARHITFRDLLDRMSAPLEGDPETCREPPQAAIREYFLGARTQPDQPLVELVIAAWVEHFSVVIPRDAETYVARLCREFQSKGSPVSDSTE